MSDELCWESTSVPPYIYYMTHRDALIEPTIRCSIAPFQNAAIFRSGLPTLWNIYRFYNLFTMTNYMHVQLGVVMGHLI
jgi:hypothetical protein